jgi:Delta24-sterol reductase
VPIKQGLPACTIPYKVRLALFRLPNHLLSHAFKLCITVGGGFSGTSGESSTFKHGLFSSTVSEVEVVLDDGTLKLASRHENEDLLRGAAGTMGTLGVVVLLTVELMEAKNFVSLELLRAPVLNDIPSMLESATKREVDFINSISFNDRLAVIMVRKISQRPTGILFNGRRIRWFADHIHELAYDQAVNSISLRLKDYLFRYNHGAFWGARLVFKHFHKP